MNDAVGCAERSAKRLAGRSGPACAFGGAALALSALVVGCVADSGPSTTLASGGASPPWSGGGSTSGSIDTVPDSGVPPMVVDVDPGGTLTAPPGSGVGVFTEYASGGHWRVWWTCDTLVTSQSCAFQISVSATSGTLSEISDVGLGRGDVVSQERSGQILAQTDTTTGRDEIDFDAAAGVSIELDVVLEPQPSSNFLFFVQNGQVNGGYQGNLTDPLILGAFVSLTLAVVVGLGANLGDRLDTMRTALRELGRFAPVVRTSQVYVTAPVGGAEQPDFLNAAALLKAPEAPLALLDAMLAVEQRLGRVRRERWGPRIIDLDVLWIEGVAVDTPRLVVPHPRLRARAFALAPMLEIVPDARDPRTGERYEVPAGEVRGTGEAL